MRKEEAVVLVLGFNRNKNVSVLMGFSMQKLQEANGMGNVNGCGDLAAENSCGFIRARDIKGSMMAAIRDAIFGWSTERIVRDEAKAGMPSYFYFFDHGYPAAEGLGYHAFPWQRTRATSSAM